MPNWCVNRLSITGPQKELRRFQKQAASSTADGADRFFSFDVFVPAPNNMYTCDWCCDHWGTKWNAAEVIDKSDRKELQYEFDTAWNPPSAWLRTVAVEQYPRLSFELEYYESGNCFAGRETYVKGDCAGIVNDLNYMEMQIAWYGTIDQLCDECDDEFATDTPISICPDCWTNRCVHCLKMKDDHGEHAKCLFAPTHFKARG